jgi:hypothetical protein
MTKEEFLKLAASRYDQIKALQKHETFYGYEKEFEQIWLDLGKEVLEDSLGEVPEERRKKKDIRADSDT